MSIDDDIVMLTPDEIEFGYQTWREFPDRLGTTRIMESFKNRFLGFCKRNPFFKVYGGCMGSALKTFLIGVLYNINKSSRVSSSFACVGR